MAYSELIKNFDSIRDYLFRFYIYGFGTRDEVGEKSPRSYDNERRRLQSWLGDYMESRRDAQGKNVFITVDSRDIACNPLYKAFKTKSFTDNDIILHFFILDALNGEEELTLNEISDYILDRLEPDDDGGFVPDDSVLRKKLKEYTELGLVTCRKEGRKAYYRRACDTVPLDRWREALTFFAEEGQLGVVGSYLLDKLEPAESAFIFKHHYLLHAMESDVLYGLLAAMEQQRAVGLDVFVRRSEQREDRVTVPLKIYVSTQSGRRYLLGWNSAEERFAFHRLDSIRRVRLLEVCPDYEELVRQAEALGRSIWGVSLKSGPEGGLQTLSFIIRIEEDEQFVLRRLEREKRCGSVEDLGEGLYRYSAEVLDPWEMLPWVRTFIGRIAGFECSDKKIEELFLQDLRDTCALYGEEESHAVQ